jgi:superfamily II DNA/RNA helicase
MIAGRDVLASAPTGSGKTAAFILPIIARLRCHTKAGPRAIILAPTRELVQQIAREGRRLSSGTGIRFSELTKGAAFGAYGAEKDAKAKASPSEKDAQVPEPRKRAAAHHRHDGEDDDDDDESEEDAAAAAAAASASASSSRSKPNRPKNLQKQRIPAVDVLVTTPQRLAWLVEAVVTSSGSADSLALPHVGVVVLDEADRLLKAGDRDALRALDSVLSAAPASAQRALFSATVHSGVEDAAEVVLRDAVTITVGRAMSAASSVEQKLVFVGREAGKLLELRQMAKTGFAPPVLVFLQSKERAEDACHELRLDGIRADVIHSDRTPAEREDVIRRFRSGEIWMLLATEVVARGLDFKAVKTVVNFDVPATVSEYVHRIGRTGRAGRKGTAITLFTEDDFPLLRPIANVAKLSGAEVQPWLLTLAKPSGRRKAKAITRTAVSRERDRARFQEREKRRQGRPAGKSKPASKI